MWWVGGWIKKKLLSKSNWFRRNKKGSKEEQSKKKQLGQLQGGTGATNWGGMKDKELAVRSVLFVEQSPRGELAKLMRRSLTEMEHILGFKVKVAERSGMSLGCHFLLGSLWDGSKCGRGDCVMFEQGMEELPHCTKKSLVYQNICINCNPGATEKGELMEVRDDIPTLYVGETSCSIYERGREHYDGAKTGSKKNHMVKHQTLVHGGEPAPYFVLKVINYHQTPLARQVAEVVRIRRRGGSNF